jgi:LuxR family maltose regulon positive regulatory protein
VGPQAVLLSDGRVSLARDRCCLDLWSFEATLARLDQVLSHPESVPRACARMKELYSGDFLAGESAAPWLIAPRERLRARFLAALEQLGSAMLAAGMAEKARACYEHGLTIDPLVEQFYQGLMRCYWHLDRLAEVQTTLARCRQVLRTSLGLECSAATEALAVNPAPPTPAGKK